jgi:hypothetical protein
VNKSEDGMKVKAIKQSTKTDWWIVKTVNFAPVIALARDKYLNPFDDDYGNGRYDESCEAVRMACEQIFGEHSGYIISEAYVTWASKLGLRCFDSQHERIIWLNFLEQYCLTEKVVLECQVNINPFSDEYDTRLFKIKSSI